MKGAIILVKKKVKRIRKKIKKGIPIAVYIATNEVMFSDFKKIVNKGDTLLEMPLKEARLRKDFIVRNESGD